jgi:hypothetical protein
MTHTQEELEAMDREDLKALADEKGLEYAPTIHTPTLINLILESEQEGQPEVTAEGAEVEAQAEVEATEEVEATTEEVPDYYPPIVYSPWELPANTAAAQNMISTGAVVVDETLVPEDDVLAAANNEIALYGHPEDPRLVGASIVSDQLTQEQLGAPPPREIEPFPEVEDSSETFGQRLEREAAGESETEEAASEAETEEATV